MTGRDARAWVLATCSYLLIYGALLAAMHARVAGYEIVEPLFVLGVYGGVFSTIAWLVTLNAVPRDVAVKDPARETALVLAYFLFLVLFITYGFTAVRSLASDPTVQHGAIIVTKLVVFVLVPFLALRALYGYRIVDFIDLRAGLRGHWFAFVVIGAALIAFQLVFGRAGRELPALHAGPGELALGTLIAFVIGTLEAGIVEEYFFRALLLQRLAAWLRAPGPALVISSLLFGLAHAPGLYLRPELTLESVTEPSLLMAVGYSVVILSVAGLMFGLLWLRTRNLLLVALLHGLNDCVPAIAGTVRSLSGG
jgi:membrane protease YdiL (CAAX protease family)